MKLELKNIQHAKNWSEETNAFTATIYIDGKKVGTAKNDGRGGQTDVDPLFFGMGDEELAKRNALREVLREADEYFQSLPPEVCKLGDGRTFTSTRTLDGEIDRLVEEDLILKDLKRDMRTKIVVQLPDASLATYKLKRKFSEIPAEEFHKIKARLIAKGERVLNGLSDAELLKAAACS